MDAAVRTINGWRKGTPGTNNNKDFKTFAARNMVRILTITARLLENTKNKADATDIIKVLKSAAKLIENLEPAGRNRRGRQDDVGRPRQPPPVKQNQADLVYDPGLRCTANNKSREANQDTKTNEKEELGNHRPLREAI